MDECENNEEQTEIVITVRQKGGRYIICGQTFGKKGRRNRSA